MKGHIFLSKNCHKWFMICDHTSIMGEAVVVDFSRSMSRASLSMLLYHVFALVRLLFVNVVGCCMELPGASFLEKCILSLNGRTPAPNPTLDMPVSRFSCSFSLLISLIIFCNDGLFSFTQILVCVVPYAI